MSDSVNPILETSEQIFKSLVWDNLVKAELTSLYASSTILTFFKPLIDAIMTVITNSLFSNFKTYIDLGAVQLLDSQAESTFRTASITLAILAHDKGVNSDEFKKARENAKSALSTFIRYRQ